jgi:large subunit ribosomal protein L13
MNEVKIDVIGMSYGRAATIVAAALIGKDKTDFAYNRLCGDTVIVSNVEKLTITGRKAAQKTYYKHSGYIGNLKEKSLGKLYAENPKLLFAKTVKGMLPHNKLADQMIKKLKFEE